MSFGIIEIVTDGHDADTAMLEVVLHGIDVVRVVDPSLIQLMGDFSDDWMTCVRPTVRTSEHLNKSMIIKQKLISTSTETLMLCKFCNRWNYFGVIIQCLLMAGHILSWQSIYSDGKACDPMSVNFRNCWEQRFFSLDLSSGLKSRKKELLYLSQKCGGKFWSLFIDFRLFWIKCGILGVF